MLKRLPARTMALMAKEWRRLATFGTVGLASVALTLVLYGLLTRIIWRNGPRTPLYVAVVILVAWVNYELNRHFTFDARMRTAGSMGRFASVAVVATGLYSVLFWLGHEAFGFWDFGVIMVNQVCVGLFTFTSHKLFTFHEHPWRFFIRHKGQL